VRYAPEESAEARSAAAEAGIGTMRPPAHTNQQLRTIDIYCRREAVSLCVCVISASITHRGQRVCSIARGAHSIRSNHLYAGRNECLELNWKGILILRQPAALIESIR
jgi:hypothetical protein